MRVARRLTVAVAFGVLMLTLACGHPSGQPNAAPARDPVAPDSFQVSIATSRGPLLLSVHRDWAPLGVDRFYQLVKRRYYDGARIYRVVPGFVAQFGLAADPRLTATMRNRRFPDDSVRRSNVRGTVSFARGDRNTRTAQLFINLVDNKRLDAADGFGFPPIGRLVNGMEVAAQFDAEYEGTMPFTVQDSITEQGNAYLVRVYPRLDFIVTMTIVKQWR